MFVFKETDGSDMMRCVSTMIGMLSRLDRRRSTIDDDAPTRQSCIPKWLTSIEIVCAKYSFTSSMRRATQELRCVTLSWGSLQLRKISH